MDRSADDAMRGLECLLHALAYRQLGRRRLAMARERNKHVLVRKLRAGRMDAACLFGAGRLGFLVV